MYIWEFWCCLGPMRINHFSGCFSCSTQRCFSVWTSAVVCGCVWKFSISSTNIFIAMYCTEYTSRSEWASESAILSMCVPVSLHIFNLFEWLYFRYERHDRTTKYKRNEDTEERAEKKQHRKKRTTLRDCLTVAGWWLYISYEFTCVHIYSHSHCDLPLPHSLCVVYSISPLFSIVVYIFQTYWQVGD